MLFELAKAQLSEHLISLLHQKVGMQMLQMLMFKLPRTNERMEQLNNSVTKG